MHINLRILAEGISIRFSITIYQKYYLRYNLCLAYIFSNSLNSEFYDKKTVHASLLILLQF